MENVIILYINSVHEGEIYTANVLSAEIADECLQTKSTNN